MEVEVLYFSKTGRVPSSSDSFTAIHETVSDMDGDSVKINESNTRYLPMDWVSNTLIFGDQEEDLTCEQAFEEAKIK